MSASTTFALPKQWRHWAKVNRLRPHGKVYHKRTSWTYLVGRGRVWRIAYDYEGEKGYTFQGGDRLPEFDRWALSRRYEFPVPQSLAEFTQVVRSLSNAP